MHACTRTDGPIYRCWESLLFVCLLVCVFVRLLVYLLRVGGLGTDRHGCIYVLYVKYVKYVKYCLCCVRYVCMYVCEAFRCRVSSVGLVYSAQADAARLFMDGWS